MIAGSAASLVIVSGFVLPGILMSQRLKSHKINALEKLDVNINEEVTLAMQVVDHPGGVPNLQRLKALLDLHDRISERLVWPLGWKAVRTASSITVVSYVPVIFQWLLGRLV